MAAKSTTYSGDVLKLAYNATPIANIADNAGTSPLTNLYVSLHTASPGASGTQATSEAAYTGYARVAVARTTGGFTVTTNIVDFVADVVFPAATGGTETETYFAVGTASSGAGKILHFGPLTPSISVSSGVTPKILAAGSSISET